MNGIRFKKFIKRDYLKLQEKLFKGMNVDDIYRKAQEYLKGKGKGNL